MKIFQQIKRLIFFKKTKTMAEKGFIFQESEKLKASREARANSGIIPLDSPQKKPKTLVIERLKKLYTSTMPKF